MREAKLKRLIREAVRAELGSARPTIIYDQRPVDDGAPPPSEWLPIPDERAVVLLAGLRILLAHIEGCSSISLIEREAIGHVALAMRRIICSGNQAKEKAEAAR